jgi:ABC-type amino acid transport substrate-binding protein
MLIFTPRVLVKRMGHWIRSKNSFGSGQSRFYLSSAANGLSLPCCPGREFADAKQVDRPGIKVGVGRNTSSDQFLSKTLKSAEVVRLGGGQAVEALTSGSAHVWAASASNIQQFAEHLPDSRIVPGGVYDRPGRTTGACHDSKSFDNGTRYFGICAR